jgi:phosphoribosylformylglycinamidine (FGAM) synthase-like enzyme
LALREGVESLSKCCVDLNISVPVGKDSLSMRTKWDDGSAEKGSKESSIRSYNSYGTCS